MITSSFANNLEEKDKALIEKFSNWLNINKAATEQVCTFLSNKIGDKELMSDFKNLSDDIKLQACLEYLTIGLVAGSVGRKEVENLLRK